ncbi:unnamed protein product [Brassicogethes aeneus]|uniref:Aftiphilin clathrin-binding box domain-containing protein n=1 Tax=Brassicogethes aeneus TaxID=1431903 RepID=A0A9P0AWY3_BRAAE|nr:unnamed protein product [Brassicogethes aeneus]
MSNIIPPLLSNSPPPIMGALDDDEDDDFGNFRAAHDLSYSCDNLSLPSSPYHSPDKEDSLDINRNSSKDKKDFHDRRKESFSTNGDFSGFTVDTPPPLSASDIVTKTNEKSEPYDEAFKNHDISDDTECSLDKINIVNSFVDAEQEICDSISLGDESTEISKKINDELLLNNVKNLTIGDDVNISQIKIDDFGEFLKPPDNLKEEIIKNYVEKPLKSEESDLSKEENPAKFEVLKIEENYVNGVDFDEPGDDFGDFEAPIEEITKIENIVNDEENKEDLDKIEEKHDNFEEFSSFEDADDANEDKMVTNHEIIKDCTIENETEENEDEFGDFECNFKNEEPQSQKTYDDFGNFEAPKITEEEDFDDDFGDFATASTSKKEETEFGDFPNENFGNFANFEETDFSSVTMLTLERENVLEKCELILKEMFPDFEKNPDTDLLIDEITKDDAVFEEIKDLTETNALEYQWSKSTSQKVLLKSLNIDTRNILHGSAWNPSMPRFAANLGSTPLEPIKPEVIRQPATKPVEVNLATPGPAASAATAPATLEIPSAQFDWTGSGLINPLDSATAKEKDSTTGLNVAEVLQPIATQPPTISTNRSEDFDDFDDFSSYTPQPQQSWSNMVPVPLRETHISSYEGVEKNVKDFGWLQPTIVTPEMPRKEIVEEKPTVTIPIESHDDFDVFGEFESVKATEEPTPSKIDQIDDEDDFTDFHSSIPEPKQPVENKMQPPETLQPIRPAVLPLEPLKPSIMTPQNLSTQINWPDPGISDEDLKRFEVSFSKAIDVDEKPKMTSVEQKPQKEDDEWSDFVSVQKPSPVHKFNKIERSPTPDLPLSVLTLGNLQPARQPIPVVTPQGLMQTKISTQALDNDDWSDFVSSPLPQTNGCPDNRQKTNITTNPAHFAAQGKSAHVRISSISALPDLDFRATGSWSNNRK